MFRSKYDADATTWSPEGRLLQVESAMKAVQLGQPSVGIHSNTHAVLACLMSRPTEFSSYQQKIYKIDEHIAIATSGLTADGRGLCRMLRDVCLNHRYAFGTESRPVELAEHVSAQSQKRTQKFGGRPYGAGLLLIGVVGGKAQLFETCPSGQHWDMIAQAMGRRSQAAKTYLEAHVDEFAGCDGDALLRHAFRALQETAGKEELGLQSVAAAVVGIDEPCRELAGDQLRPFIQGAGGA